MDINALLSKIEAARQAGACVVLKWDSERQSNRCSVAVTYSRADWFFRRDTDHPDKVLAEGLAEFFQLVQRDS